MAEKYNTIVKYMITATCAQPLHIGGAMGDKQEVLVHPVDNLPFIQATSITGVFREHYRKLYGEEETDALFGVHKASDESSERGSKICFGDGKFVREKLMMEYRPRVSIDPATATCSSSMVKGTTRKSGHKFEMEYVGAGSVFEFPIYLYQSEKKENIEEMLSAMEHESIQFGGQKSNGCGYMTITKVLCKSFCMTEEKERKLWYREDTMQENEYENLSDTVKNRGKKTHAYEIIVKGKTEGEILVKSLGVTDYDDNTPDCVNIQNARKEYIVPGSSFKGAMRSQMEKIASYLGKPEIIEDIFGRKADEHQKGKIGNVSFLDTVIGEKEANDKNHVVHRIRIDKFTGGVMHTGLFEEKNAFGNMEFKINISNHNSPELSCGLLLMALRDLAIGTMSIGGGYNTGKGIIDVSAIEVNAIQKEQKAVIDFKNKSILGDRQVVLDCLAGVEKGVS